jgi:hypothetical protein
LLLVGATARAGATGESCWARGHHEKGITMTDSESITSVTPSPEVKTENLVLANVTARLTT